MTRLLAFGAVVAVLVALATGCGVGDATEEGTISAAADTYLRSLMAKNAATACEQLTADARATLGPDCERALRQLAARVGVERLEDAADGGLEIDADGGTASAVVRELGARLTLIRVGEIWRIDGGYRLDSP